MPPPLGPVRSPGIRPLGSVWHQGTSPSSSPIAVVIQNSPATIRSLTSGRAAAPADQDSNTQAQNAGDGSPDLFYTGRTRGDYNGHNTLIGDKPGDSRGTKRGHETRETEPGSDKEPRRSGKRLTTKEEILLFEICIRHADTFGKRSEICDWWRYSWHSVRRKVENVTKRRDQFLRDTKSSASHSQEQMNPRWREVLDEWLPTWRRWEEAEAKRIAKRDEMLMRRTSAHHQSQAQPQVHGSANPLALNVDRQRAMESQVGGPASASPGHGDDPMHSAVPDAVHGPSPMAAVRQSKSPPLLAPSNLSATVKLPPGYETMFSNPHPATTKYQPAPQAPPRVSPPGPLMPPRSGQHSGFGLLDTFNRISSTPKRGFDTLLENESAGPRSEPEIDALVQAAADASAQSRSEPDIILQRERSHDSLSMDIEFIKEELRREIKTEMRREMDQSWAAVRERIDSVQETQQLILEMLRHNSS
ncbi:hypothetical protein N7468_009939 [Penicillium chermesinum]|uniref:Uncharacterized protein n=1 Tax=Penicillium chermesinum TaxID=63820 RepID=A0A9W9NBR7_9EURO|nr:uncharacterized protein N7468_009939 [Penicillium chermesinum]KAJ5216931.1 hypothetical protein N7468_009939 [Penicillium chermesinum]